MIEWKCSKDIGVEEELGMMMRQIGIELQGGGE